MSPAATAPQPPSGPRAARKRQAIVTAARTLFLREGFGVGMDAIAAEAGVSKVTVYNHFGSKEALFTAVIAGALDHPSSGPGGGEDSAAPLARLAEAADGDGDGELRTAFMDAARAWVHAVRDDREVAALRTLVSAELHRFPELGEAWRHDSPTGHHPVVAGALRTLTERGRLDIPDLEVATLQLYALLVHPHMVFGQYGAVMDDDLTERLLVSGVDMFLAQYAAGA
ncbi:TetR/AcrR family transcriptional regulator [Streptomyces jumonjinensis]|uniref:TetR/AcrR family transcriptional regulator n=1 Tax=Streptomyces jumonjinensis TaxID=1945 RepID=A0A646KGU5_STRJU|nr:TetR/AcrR family transcriptional regulator [Streptomyces jumonjinensis]MQT01444.1 TetR/AcrR family transcriptional regulator [Streptomyces jumonjinensis]